jgi:aldose 1-epimerase
MKYEGCFGARLALLALATSLVNCGGTQATTSAPPTGTTAAPAVTPALTPTAAPVPATAASSNAGGPKQASVTKSNFGTADGKEVNLYVLTNAKGSTLKVMNYGAIVTELHVPDRTGKFADIVGGFENLDGYLKKSPYFGGMIGRVANRITNARFQLEGKTYKLTPNDPPNALHGGKKGWDKVVWDVIATNETPQGPTIKLTYLSKDGEEGYPGNVTATVTYALTNDNEFKIDMEAVTDKTTIVNMAHHGYWNLGGYDSGSIADHELTLYADKYTPGAPVVANGVIKPVQGTPFDFTKPKPIGKDMSAVMIKGTPAPGYDHNFVVNGDPHAMRPVAKIKDPKSGRVMTLEGNQPGVMFYAGLFLDGTITGKGHVYQRYDAFCMETQKFPNSINVPAWKDEVILKPGQTYKHTMVHRFTSE